ncbi:MAG: UDP binding domain-containing protein, partial [Gammaproteobacteria bacterium]|nr:UDP binding domain-containing protein [Gammaproteobacteria bacterium]
AFKPNTDDMREAPSRVIVEELLGAGAAVCAFDPVAMPQARRVFGDRAELSYADDALQTLDGSDALLIVTEWQMFRSPDFDAIKSRLKQPIIFDGRNLYDPRLLKRFGITYYAIGRGEPLIV